MKRKQQDTEALALLSSPQMERAFIISLLGDVCATGYTMALAPTLLADDFTDENHRFMWQLCIECKNAAVDVNTLNVYTQGTKHGKSIDITRYINTRDAGGDPMTLAASLHEMGQKRRIAESIEGALLSLYHDDDFSSVDAIGELEKAIKESNDTRQMSVKAWSTAHMDLLKSIEQKMNGTAPQGVMTGFSLIDRKGGMERGELMIVAGRNSNGKTSLALCMALQAAEAGEAVGFFSLEMTTAQLTTRLASLRTGINGEDLKRGTLEQSEFDRLVSLPNLPIYFDEKRSSDAEQLINNIRAMREQKGVQVVVIDYLQLLRSRERERVQQIGGIAHRLEALSKQLEITIILLSQLRRNTGTDPTPRLEELKESGDIADAADSIYMVYRPERHDANLRYPDMSQAWSQYSTHGTALLMNLKNRNGEMYGEQLLGFDAGTTRFYEREDFALADDMGPSSLDDIFN